MRKLDLYLSRKAQAVWPTARVYREELAAAGDRGPSVRFVLEREGEEPVDLGGPFGVAKGALYVLRNAARSKEGRAT